MFGIGMSEMLIILAVALLVFGPTKLPEIAKSIAKGLKEIRKAGDDLRSSVNFDLDDDKPAARPPRRIEPPAPAITGSDLATAAEAPAASAIPPALSTPTTPAAPASTAEPWPKPADGTLAQGGLGPDDDTSPVAAAGAVATGRRH